VLVWRSRDVSAAQGVFSHFSGKRSTGIGAATAHRPALILLDVNMPGMNGYAVTRAIRQCEQIAGIPIVGISANNDIATRIKAVEAGMNDFVPKPWAGSDIDRALQYLFHRIESTVEHAYKQHWFL
jgi:CheY-like chemotaxis protein